MRLRGLKSEFYDGLSGPEQRKILLVLLLIVVLITICGILVVL